MDVVIFQDGEKLSQSAAEYIVRVAREAVADHGNFTIALSGGSTPRKLYGMLAEEPYRSQIAWDKIEIFWSDERCVPPSDPESNYHLAEQVMLSKLSLSPNQVHRMPADKLIVMRHRSPTRRRCAVSSKQKGHHILICFNWVWDPKHIRLRSSHTRHRCMNASDWLYQSQCRSHLPHASPSPYLS